MTIYINNKMTSTNQNIYSCTQCDYETENKYSYGRHLKTKLHLRRLNSGVKHLVYSCSVDGCDYITRNKSNFNRHVKTHSDTIIHTRECKLCNMTFRDKANIKKHRYTTKHCKKFTEKFNELVNEKLDQKVLMMKTDKKTGINLYTIKKGQLKKQLQDKYFIKIKKEVPRINKKKNDKNNKTKDETNKKVIYKKLTHLEIKKIFDNYQDYDESIIPKLIFSHPIKTDQKEFEEQFNELEQNKLENKEYKNQIYDLIYEISEDIITVLEDESFEDL